MIKLLGERNYLYQWDLNQRLAVSKKVTEVHFSHKGDEKASVLLPYEKDGERVVDIPNNLLQSAENLIVYVYITNEDESHTEIHYELTVYPRERPASYVYEATEVLSSSQLCERVKKLEENQQGGEVDPEEVKQIVEDYLEENPPAPGANGKDGKDGVNGKDGIDGKDGQNGADGKDGAVVVTDADKITQKASAHGLSSSVSIFCGFSQTVTNIFGSTQTYDYASIRRQEKPL